MDRRNFIKVKFLLILFVFIGCNAKQNNEVDEKKNQSKFFVFQNSTKMKSLNYSNLIDKDELCLKKIFKELDVVLENSYDYSILESEFKSWDSPRKIYYDISKFSLSNDLKSNLDVFLENNNPETLKIISLNNGKNNYLFFIGKSIGATGIGVRYNNYFIINLDTSFFLQQDSISENPFSIFIDQKDNLNIIVFDENFRNENIETENSFFYSLLTVNKNEKIRSKKVKFVCK
jgi:hypothetical protein